MLFVGVFFAVTSFRERQNTHEMSPKWHFIAMNDGGEVFLTDTEENKNTTVLLVHGTGSWWGIWEETVNELKSKNYRVITIDLPPFGYSTKYIWSKNYTREKQVQRIKKVIENLHLKNVVLVAHSIGARSAIELVMSVYSITHSRRSCSRT